MRKENTMEQHDSTEAPLCDACRRIPISHLALDVSEPLVGWAAFFEARDVQVFDDAIGRPSVARYVLGDLIAEQRARDARLAEEAANAATLNQPVPVVGIPAREGLSAHENMMAQDGYTSPRDEFERFPRPSFLDEEFARTREHQRAEQEVARRKEKAK
jgi:hypothetical protein